MPNTKCASINYFETNGGLENTRKTLRNLSLAAILSLKTICPASSGLAASRCHLPAPERIRHFQNHRSPRKLLWKPRLLRGRTRIRIRNLPIPKALRTLFSRAPQEQGPSLPRLYVAHPADEPFAGRTSARTSPTRPAKLAHKMGPDQGNRSL